MKAKKKVYIVFEETGPQPGGEGFSVYMAGDIDKLNDTPESLRTPAEFWGARCFGILVNVMEKAGVIKTQHKRSKTQ